MGKSRALMSSAIKTMTFGCRPEAFDPIDDAKQKQARNSRSGFMIDCFLLKEALSIGLVVWGNVAGVMVVNRKKAIWGIFRPIQASGLTMGQLTTFP